VSPLELSVETVMNVLQLLLLLPNFYVEWSKYQLIAWTPFLPVFDVERPPFFSYLFDMMRKGVCKALFFTFVYRLLSLFSFGFLFLSPLKFTSSKLLLVPLFQRATLSGNLFCFPIREYWCAPHVLKFRIRHGYWIKYLPFKNRLHLVC